jgi:DNA polymerase III delta prime subunit
MLSQPPGALHKTCLVMDEVDGMSGGDRGGVAEIIDMIKKTRTPIICICNDAYSRNLKSLRYALAVFPLPFKAASGFFSRSAPLHEINLPCNFTYSIQS